MEFIEKNGKQIGFAALGLIAIGFLITYLSSRSHHQESAIQEKLSSFELEYSKYKEDFAKTQSPETTAENQATKDNAEQKNKAAEISQLNEKVKANRQKMISDLEKFISENPKTIASSMASLYLSEMMMDESKKAEALEVLKKGLRQTDDLASVLVQKKIGSLQADSNQCDEALKTWDQILKNKKAQYAYSEVKILQSLCYQKNNDLKKAEDLLTSVKNDKTEGSQEFSQRAEKILRLIQFKKMSGT